MFPKSTQRNAWVYTTDQLATLRSANTTSNANTTLTTKARLSYVLKVSHMCQYCEIPLTVEATAIVYFQRFFLKATVVVDPKHVVLAAIYLAAKVEEWKTGALESLLNKLSNTGDVEPKQIVQTELLVLQAMSFHITVFHPFQCHRALIRELSQTHKWKGGLSQEKQRSVHDVLNGGGGGGGSSGSSSSSSSNRNDKPMLKFLTTRSLQLLKRSYMTDACFLYSPAQLALASVIAACHRPGSAGITSPNTAMMAALQSDIGLFAEAYFRKFQDFDQLLNTVQGATQLIIANVFVDGGEEGEQGEE